MIRIIKLSLFFLCCTYALYAHADAAYLQKFLTYTHWLKHMPTGVDAEFLRFVAEPSPLTRSLREKWLTQLAHTHDEATFIQYYDAFQQSAAIQSNDLQCYAPLARYHQGQRDVAIREAKTLWLSGSSQPKACDELFTLMLHEHVFTNDLITARILLALDNKQFGLAQSLFKYLNPPRNQDLNALHDIRTHPTHITQLADGPFQSALYLVGLKQLIPRDMQKAIELSQTPAAKKSMTVADKQRFIAQIALYKAMRGEADAITWFNQIQAPYITPTLTEWRIRDAIAHQRWQDIITLIAHTPLEETPAWQYWLARAYEATGEKDKARALYQSLGMKRHYYGFLASIRLHRPLHFEHESTVTNPQTLAIYKPITDEIRALYHSGQAWMASRLLNAFSSELPKEEQSALAYWVNQELHWQGKSIVLSNTETLNNELSLRFPLAYRTFIQQMAAQYHVDPAFIYAIIRQESLFFENIVSAAGAKGLMQLMPITAKAVTTRARIRYGHPDELFNTEKNIQIGTAYLNQLAHEFHAHPVLMIAAYNAGPKQARYWKTHHAPKDIDLWIETLPWQETRNYLKNVIAFYAVYQYRLQEKPNLNPFLKPLE